MAKKEKPPKDGKGAWPHVERRRRKDWIQTAITVTTGVGWVGAFALTVLLEKASPQKATFFDHFLGNPVYSYWNVRALRQALFVIILVFGLGLIGLCINLTRLRREGDKLNKANLLLLILTGIGIILFIWRFGDML